MASTEITPLLRDLENGQSDVETPSISAVLLDIENELALTLRTVRGAVELPGFSLAQSAGFHVTVVLCLLTRMGPRSCCRDAVEFDARTSLLNKILKELLDDFFADTRLRVLNASGAFVTVDEFLWTRFPWNTVGTVFLGVADLLSRGVGVRVLLRDIRVLECLNSTWRGGLSELRFSHSSPCSLGRSYEHLSTPRVSHALDILLHLIYLGNLASILLQPNTSYRIRDVFHISCALGATTKYRPQSLRFAQACAFLSFVFSIPVPPVPGTLPHHILLFSFSWSVIALLFPITPSPIFLLAPEVSLPPAVEFASILTPVIVRPVLYFLPIIIITTFLVSASLEDPWSLFVHCKELVTFASPYSTRVVFFALFCTSIILMVLYSGFSLVRYGARPSSDGESPDHSSLKLTASRVLIGAINVYGRNFPFPPPLNLISLVLVTLPRSIAAHLYSASPLVASHSHHSSELPSGRLERREKLLWYIVALPLEIIVAGIWGWRSIASTVP